MLWQLKLVNRNTLFLLYSRRKQNLRRVGNKSEWKNTRDKSLNKKDRDYSENTHPSYSAFYPRCVLPTSVSRHIRGAFVWDQSGWNKYNWNNASKRLFGSYSHSGIPGFTLRLFCSQGQNSRNVFQSIFRDIFLFRNIPNEHVLD